MALLWIAMTVMTGIFVFIFYKLIKEEKDDKKELDLKSKTPKAPKPVAAVSRRPRAKANQGDAGIFSASSGIGNSHVVVNITNHPSDPASMSSKDSSTKGERANELRDYKFCPASRSAKDGNSADTQRSYEQNRTVISGVQSMNGSYETLSFISR
jgi:hypothetical protein